MNEAIDEICRAHQHEPTPPLTAFGRNPVSGGEIVGHIMADGTVRTVDGEELELQFNLDGEILNLEEAAKGMEQMVRVKQKKKELEKVKAGIEEAQTITHLSEINLGEHGLLNGIRT